MTTFSVPDMSCGHCKASVEAALGALSGVKSVSVDLSQRQISVAGTAEISDILASLTEIGFPAAPISAD